VKCWTLWSFNIKDWKVVVPRICLECEFHIMLHIELLSTFSSWENEVVDKRVLGFVLWKTQSVWHGYSKKVACERRHATMKVHHDSRNVKWHGIRSLVCPNRHTCYTK
jgi:hypothetical protein